MYIIHFIVSTPLSVLSYLLFPPISSSSEPLPFLIPYFTWSLIYLVNPLVSWSLLTRSWVCLKGPGQLPAATLLKTFLKGSSCMCTFNQSTINQSPMLLWAQLLSPRGKLCGRGKAQNSSEWWQEVAEHRETDSRAANGNPSFYVSNISILVCIRPQPRRLPKYNAAQAGKEMTVLRNFTLQTGSGGGTLKTSCTNR